ncbi:MAG: hypothetical protein WCK31_00340 [bacterium]
MRESAEYHKTLEPIEYYGSIQAMNEQSIERLRSVLTSVEFKSDAVLVAVGSDGKGERHDPSKIELKLIMRSPVNANSQLIIEEVNTAIADSPYSTIVEKGMIYNKALNEKNEIFDVVSISSGEVLSYAFNQESAVFPDRVINTCFILGNPELLIAAKRKVMLEITDGSELSKRIYSELRNQLGDYKLAMRTGIYRGKKVFDRELSLQYYTEDINPLEKKTGFKIAYLRATQRKCDLLTFALIRSGRLTIEEAIRWPTNTLTRIEYILNVVNKEVLELSKKNKKTPIEISASFQQAYAWFLKEYHIIQDEYTDKKVEVEMSFNKEEFEIANQNIEAFLELQLNEKNALRLR